MKTTCAFLTLLLPALAAAQTCPMPVEPIDASSNDSVHCDVAPDSCVAGTCRCLTLDELLAQAPPESWEEIILGKVLEQEWWYWSGHLFTLDTHRSYGFAEVVYSAIDLESFVPLHWADHVFSDPKAKRYAFAGRETNVGTPAYVEDNGFVFDFPTAFVWGGDGVDHIAAQIAGDPSIAVDLTLFSLKAPATNRADGLVYYYSRTRMVALGTVTIDGRGHPVVGSFWFDRQFGMQRAAYQNVDRWTWLATQLDDGRELVIYDVEMDPGETRCQYAGGVVEGTLVERDGTVVRLGRVELGRTGAELLHGDAHAGAYAWPSAALPACSYDLGWRIRVPSLALDLTVTPTFDAQEIVVNEPSPGPDLVVGDRYWEGVSRVTDTATGKQVGRAWVELFGYCPVGTDAP